MKYEIELTKPKIILFDWDDTLVDTGHFLRRILHETLDEMEISDLDKQAVVKYSNHSLRDAFPKIFGDRWEEVRDIYYAKIQQLKPDMVATLPHALEAIKFFAEEGILMSVVSNKNATVLREEVKRLGWEHYFHKVVGATDAARDKPWSEPVELALDGIGMADKHGTWFIGDSIVDVQCATNTKCTPMLFGYNQDSIAQVKQLQLSHVHVKDHGHLIDLYNNC